MQISLDLEQVCTLQRNTRLGRSMVLPKLLALLSTKGNFCHSRLFSQSGHAVPSEAQIGGGSSLQAMLCVLLCLWWGEVRGMDRVQCAGGPLCGAMRAARNPAMLNLM